MSRVRTRLSDAWKVILLSNCLNGSLNEVVQRTCSPVRMSRPVLPEKKITKILKRLHNIKKTLIVNKCLIAIKIN